MLRIERMHWLPEAKQHEVRDVDDVVDGPNASPLEAPRQPVWAWADLHAANDCAHVARAAVDVFDCNGNATGYSELWICRDFDRSARCMCCPRDVHRLTKRGSDLSCHTDV